MQQIRKGDISKDDYKRVVLKGRKWLSEYLFLVADCFSDSEAKKKVLRVITDIYRKHMKEDEEFFWNVWEFVNERRTAREKNLFFEAITTRLVSSGEVRAEIARRHPDMYTLPEEREKEHEEYKA